MRFLFLLLPILLMPLYSHAAESTAEAKAFFQKYIELEAAFDPKIADLYSDTALITDKRTYPWGKVKELTVPADKYKQLIAVGMPLAKAKGDYSTYSDIAYSEEKEGVRIKATRFSELKKYSSNFSMLIAKDSTGKWLIVEELSESQPF